MYCFVLFCPFLLVLVSMSFPSLSLSSPILSYPIPIPVLLFCPPWLAAIVVDAGLTNAARAQIHSIEGRAKIPNKFRFPYLKEMMFFAASRYLRILREQQARNCRGWTGCRGVWLCRRQIYL